MNACDPELEIENLRKLASRNAGREIKLTRRQICKAYEDVQEGNLPLPPLVLSKDRTHMVDKKSPLRLKDYDVLFRSSSKLAAIRRIARKVGLTKFDGITKAKLITNIKNRLMSLDIHEPIILVKTRAKKKTNVGEFSNNTVSNGNSAYNNTATSGNSVNNMGNSAYNNSGNSGNAMSNSTNNMGGNMNVAANSTNNAPVGNTNSSRAPAAGTSTVAFPNKVSITGTPRFLGGGGVTYGGGGAVAAAPAAPAVVGRGMYNQPTRPAVASTNAPVIAPRPQPSRPSMGNSKAERERKAKLKQAEADLAKLKSQRNAILDERKQLTVSYTHLTLPTKRIV